MLAGLRPSAAADAGEPIAIVANQNCPIEDISFERLRSLYDGNLTELGGGQQVSLGENTLLAERFYAVLLGKSEIKVRRNWIRRVYSGSSAVPPKTMKQTDEIVRFIESTPNGICFVEYGKVTEGTKILRINGLAPSSAEYPLK